MCACASIPAEGGPTGRTAPSTGDRCGRRHGCGPPEEGQIRSAFAFQGTQNDINGGQHRWSNNFYNVGSRRQTATMVTTTTSGTPTATTTITTSRTSSDIRINSSTTMDRDHGRLRRGTRPSGTWCTSGALGCYTDFYCCCGGTYVVIWPRVEDYDVIGFNCVLSSLFSNTIFYFKNRK